MAEPIRPDELADIRRWAQQLDRLWVIVPVRGAASQARGVSGYGEKHRVAETLLRLCDEVDLARVALEHFWIGARTADEGLPVDWHHVAQRMAEALTSRAEPGMESRGDA